jgi:hypothetical protein
MTVRLGCFCRLAETAAQALTDRCANTSSHATCSHPSELLHEQILLLLAQRAGVNANKNGRILRSGRSVNSLRSDPVRAASGLSVDL